MLARVLSCAIVGLDGALVEVEVDIAPGLPAFTIVGLPDTAVQEAKERVRAAIRNAGLQFPLKRITVNLAPADLKKVGPSYDLPYAPMVRPSDARSRGQGSAYRCPLNVRLVLPIPDTARNHGADQQGKQAPLRRSIRLIQYRGPPP